jgi:REP element-mobilizing transposase RayT
MEFRRDRNSVSSLQAHLVFVTKYRRKILTQEKSKADRGVLPKCGKEDGF